MPKFGAHILIAKETARLSPTPLYDPNSSGELKAFLLGSVGPDLTLFLFDPVQGRPPAFRTILDILNTIRRTRDFLDRSLNEVNDTIDDVKDWITGGLASELENSAALMIQSLIDALKVGLLFETKVDFVNPFQGIGINQQIFTVPRITIEPRDYVGAPLRYFGHPYTSDPGYVDPKPVGDYSKWWWMDILHYRRTIEFAGNLKDRAATGFTKAYANGYFTHIAGDICGHPYINSLVGGPFRNHAHRHIVLEGLVDTWLWDDVLGADICEARLDREIDVEDGIDEIAQAVIAAMQDVYINPSGGRPPIRPNMFAGGTPSAGQLREAFETLVLYLSFATDTSFRVPSPPPGTPKELIQELRDLLQESWEEAKPPSGPLTWKKLWAAFCAAMKALLFLCQVATLPLATITRITALGPRWLLYLLQKALYDFVSEVRWLLALQGWGWAGQTDLRRAFIGEQLRPTQTDLYPFANTPRSQGYWLQYPGSAGAPPELAYTFAGPYGPNDRPSVLLRGRTYDANVDALLRELATPVPFTPERSRQIARLTAQGHQFGSAPAFALKLIEGEYPHAPFDLDGDRGYGYLQWEEYPQNGERYTDGNGGPL